MDEHESQERMRQAVMRYRELLDVMRLRLEAGERAYNALFAPLSEDERALPEKQQQGIVGRLALQDRTALERAVLHMHFECRDLQKAFEDLHFIVVDEA